MPGGSLVSKPTWSNASGRSTTSAFFLRGYRPARRCLEDTVRRPNNLLMQVEGVCLMRCCLTSFAVLLALIAFSPTQTMADKARGSGGHGGGEGGNHAGGGTQGDEHHEGVSGTQRADHHEGVGSDAGVNRGLRSNTGGSGGQGTMPNQGIDARSRSESGVGAGKAVIPAIVGAIVKTTAVGGIGGRTTGGCGMAMTANGSTSATQRVVQCPILENFSGGPIKIVNPAKSGVTLSYMLDGNAFTMPPGYSQEFQEDRAWVIEFSPVRTWIKRDMDCNRACTNLPVPTTVWICIAATSRKR